MRTTLDIDDRLFAEVESVLPAQTKKSIVEAGLRAILREEARLGFFGLRDLLSGVNFEDAPFPEDRGVDDVDD